MGLTENDAELRGRTSYLTVADKIRSMAFDGTLPIGHRLPSEVELCELFGVSRTTLREALRILSTERLITTKRGVHGGSIIAPLAPEALASLLQVSIGHLAASENCNVHELLEAREFLEVPAARKAAERRTDEHIQRLRAAIPADPSSVEPDRQFECNRDFHTAVLDAADNRLLWSLTQPIFAVVQTRFQRNLADKKWASRVASDHMAILHAIVDRDPARAAAEMALHLARLRTTYEKIDRNRRQA